MANNRKLGRTTDIRLQMVYSQASELLWHGKIETTVDRAKEVRKVAEKMLTLAINTYEDTVTVTKQKLNQKDEKFDVEFVNDGPKKLAARRKIISLTYDIQEQRGKETMADFKARTEGVQHPLIEKIFDEIAPKYAQRAEELGQRGGYTRIYQLGERRGDAAPCAIIELV